MSAIWAKFNKNERNVSFGAAIVLIAWIVGLVGYGGFGVEFLGALGAAAVLVIYYLKYAPNQNIQWPVPIPTIVLIISAIIGISAILGLIRILGILSFAGFLGIYFIALLAVTAGGVLMLFGAWQEYNATAGERAAASTTTAPSAPAPAAPAAPAAPPLRPSRWPRRRPTKAPALRRPDRRGHRLGPPPPRNHRTGRARPPGSSFPVGLGPGQCRWSTQSGGTRSSGPGTAWPRGWQRGRASRGPSTSSRVS